MLTCQPHLLDVGQVCNLPSAPGRLQTCPTLILGVSATMRSCLLCALLLAPLSVAVAQKKDKPKDQPKVILAQPFGVAPGKATKLTLRGLKLDNAKEVRAGKGTIKLLKKGKVAVPQQM